MLSFYWGRFRGHNMKSSNSGRHCKFYYSGLMGAVTVAAAAAHQSGRFCASLVAAPERMTPQVVELVSCGSVRVASFRRVNNPRGRLSDVQARNRCGQV
jgi:hypothetical protein